MFATDFIFDNKRASDFGLMIGSFNGGIETASGGEIEFSVIKAPNQDKYDFYGAAISSVLTWNFSLLKNPCTNNTDDMYFTQYEERQLAKWLLKQDGYRYFRFEQEGYEDIFYRVQINMLPHQICGRTAGFNLTVTSDCGYGYSQEFTHNFTLNKENPISLTTNSDTNSYILPYITLIGNGSFYISNDSDLSQRYSNTESDDKSTRLQNVTNTITMDSERDIITGISSPNDFSWYFLRLVNGVNNITTDSVNDIKLKIAYREPRRVIV